MSLSALIAWAGSSVFAFVTWGLCNYAFPAYRDFTKERAQVRETFYSFANIRERHPTDLARANEGSAEFGRLAARMEGLRTGLPWLLRIVLSCRGYDLEGATTGLTGLSNALWVNAGHSAVFRVQAQKALRLPFDEDDAKFADSYHRLIGMPI